VAAAAHAGGADRVELVDEDDRGRVLARLLEELANARGAEAGEHLDEGGRARGVEVRPRLVGDGLREQRLPGSRRPVEQDPLRNLRAQPLETATVTQEVDDLLKLVLCLLVAGDVIPDHAIGRAALHRRCYCPRPALSLLTTE